MTRSSASTRISATLPQGQAARVVVRHLFNPAPNPQHHWWLSLSENLAHDQNPATVVGSRVASSVSVRAEKGAVDRCILIDDVWRRLARSGGHFSSLFSLPGSHKGADQS